MGRQPQRTCIGCRNTFSKHEVVRLLGGPNGLVVDYREKLPGRGAYVCPRPACIARALARGNLERALSTKVPVSGGDELIARIAESIRAKIVSLLGMANRAGMLAMGASAVEDSLHKGRVEMLLFAQDISEGTRNRFLSGSLPLPVHTGSLLSKDELGSIGGRELFGIVGILEKGFADAAWKEMERLKNLLNEHP